MDASSEMLVAARTVRSQSILTANDVTLVQSEVPGDFTTISSVVGLESKVALYEGREIGFADVGPPAVIERNQIVNLIYSKGALQISTDARSLTRAAAGETVKVLNLASRKTVSGIVNEAGYVLVGRSLKFND